MKELILKRLRKIVAVVLLLIGIVALVVAKKTMVLGTFARPDGGFAPTVFSIALIVFSVINIVTEFFTPDSIPEKIKDVNWVKFWIFLGICAVYVFLIKKIGFVFDTFLCLLGMLKLAGLKGIVKCLIISVVFSAAIWALFTFAMNVPLPSASWF